MHRVTILLFFLPWNKAHADIKISPHIFLRDLTLYLSLKNNVENLVKKIIFLKKSKEKEKFKTFQGLSGSNGKALPIQGADFSSFKKS